jgi:hypothetical protein
LSLDEAYLDVTENLERINSATQIAEEIRARIRAEIELTPSAGVSYNKFLAKLASDHRKPNGLFVISPKMGPEFGETLPVRKFHGVGPATVAKIQRLGIKAGLDLRTRSELEQLGNALLEPLFPVAKGVRFLGSPCLRSQWKRLNASTNSGYPVGPVLSPSQQSLFFVPRVFVFKANGADVWPRLSLGRCTVGGFFRYYYPP